MHTMFKIQQIKHRIIIKKNKKQSNQKQTNKQINKRKEKQRVPTNKQTK